MTWLELYNFLYEKANNIKTLGEFNWDEEVVVYDESDEEFKLKKVS